MVMWRAWEYFHGAESFRQMHSDFDIFPFDIIKYRYETNPPPNN